MSNAVTRKNLQEALGIDGDQAKRVAARIKEGGRSDSVLRDVSDIIDGHGVESIPNPDDSDDWLATYVNTGDTYNATVLFDPRKRRYLVTTWGDWYENSPEYKAKSNRLWRAEKKFQEAGQAFDSNPTRGALNRMEKALEEIRAQGYDSGHSSQYRMRANSFANRPKPARKPRQARVVKAPWPKSPGEQAIEDHREAQKIYFDFLRGPRHNAQEYGGIARHDAFSSAGLSKVLPEMDRVIARLAPYAERDTPGAREWVRELQRNREAIVARRDYFLNHPEEDSPES